VSEEDEADRGAAGTEPPVPETTELPPTGMSPPPSADDDDEPAGAVPLWRRPRLSTVILVAVFVGAFVLWVWVRPETPPRPYQGPLVPAVVATTTTSTPKQPTTTRAPSTEPSTTVPPTSSPSTSVPPSAASTTSTAAPSAPPSTATTAAPPVGGEATTSTSTTAAP
jgi:hypothetical protein